MPLKTTPAKSFSGPSAEIAEPIGDDLDVILRHRNVAGKAKNTGPLLNSGRVLIDEVDGFRVGPHQVGPLEESCHFRDRNLISTSLLETFRFAVLEGTARDANKVVDMADVPAGATQYLNPMTGQHVYWPKS